MSWRIPPQPSLLYSLWMGYPAPYYEACQLAADELHKRQWISVEDRLPEPMYQVLIYTDDGWIGVDALDYNEEFREYDYVTHWQPLPEPPKEPSKKGV